MIHIKYQDAEHQYDENYNPITTWNEKCCNWIVNDEYIEEYNNNQIDWWGKDNDFPRGCSMDYYIKHFGNPNQLPNIELTMEWKTARDYSKMGGYFDYSQYTYPVEVYRSWGYLDYTKEQAIEHFVTGQGSYYKSVAKGSTGCILSYNGKVIYEYHVTDCSDEQKEKAKQLGLGDSIENSREMLASFETSKHLTVTVNVSDGGHYYYVMKLNNREICEWNSFDTYEQASAAVITAGLEYISKM